MTGTNGPGGGTGAGQTTRTYIEGTPGLEQRDQVLDLLRANGHEPRTNSATGFYYFVACPAAHETGPGVRVSAGRNVELACLSPDPCSRDEVVASLGLETLFPMAASALDRLRAALVDSAGLDNIPAPEPLVDGLLQRDSLAWIQGKPGSGKSFVALDIAGSVATGLSWQGWPVTQGDVLYLAAEGVSGVRQRVRAWEHAAGREMTGVRWLPVAVQVAVDAEWVAFVALAEELKPALIILDTQARIASGLEENSAKDMGSVVHRLERLRGATGACVLVVHHEGRSGEHMRGSTALEGAATTIVRVVKNENIIDVSCVKQKDAPGFEEFGLRLVPTLMSAIVTATGPSTSDGTLAILGSRWLPLWWDVHGSEPVSVSVLVKSDVVTERTFHRSKNALIRAGIASKEGTGSQTRYRLLRDPR